jgi:phage tail sheath gpL-like
MSTVQPNTDLSPGYLLPGVFVQLNLQGAGAALNNPQLRALIVGYKTAGGSASPDTPVLVTGQQDVDTRCGRGSDAARNYAAFISQIGGGQCDAFVLPLLEPSAGTAATRTITFAGSAAAQDSVELWICGYHVSTLINSGDTPTAIAAAVAAAVTLVKDIPVTATASSGTLTLTYRHKGVVGEDLPLMCYLPNNATSTVTASPGTISYSGTASGSGSATVSIGGTTYSAAVANADTSTAVAANVAAAINATNGPVTATASTGTLTLFFRSDPSAQSRVVQRPSAAMVTTTGITPTVASGTPGAGVPTLTNALSVLAAQGAFGYWSTAIADSTSLGLLSSHIETYANGVYQKDQFLWIGSTGSLTSAGTVPTAPAPALTASGRYHVTWCQDAPVQAHEISARHAAAVCVQTAVYPGTNYDEWPLVSQTASVPLLMPDRASRPSTDALNSALSTYNLTPLAVNERLGALTIVRGRNTLTSSDMRQWDTSLLQCMAFTRYNVRLTLRRKFSGKSIKTNGQPHTPYTITTQNLVDAVIELLYALDGADIIDGADQLKKAVASNVNVVNPARADMYVPVRYPTPLHQIAPVLALQ